MNGHVTPPLTLVCASANPDKVAEIERLFAEVATRGPSSPNALSLVPRPEGIPDVVEDADTLVGNARLKAEAIRRATGRPAVADDTGLFVRALPGQLGVRTARYASDDPEHAHDPYAANRRKLLGALEGVDERRAEFVTIALVSWPDGHETIAEGRCAGTIALAERGGRGFGFDPLFVPDEGDGRTFAEMTDHEKNEMSHRGRAFRQLMRELLDRGQ